MAALPNIETGDLALTRMMLSHDDFIEGHMGVDAEEMTGGSKTSSEPGVVSVHLNGEVAELLLKARGWKFETRYPLTARAWHSPDGEFCWGRDEALVLALTAEVV